MTFDFAGDGGIEPAAIPVMNAATQRNRTPTAAVEHRDPCLAASLLFGSFLRACARSGDRILLPVRRAGVRAMAGQARDWRRTENCTEAAGTQVGLNVLGRCDRAPVASGRTDWGHHPTLMCGRNQNHQPNWSPIKRARERSRFHPLTDRPSIKRYSYCPTLRTSRLQK